ncbi:PEP/pyruvate-binding domain-containing protein [Streptomyces sp. NPDC005017]|uniref:PEP/pyruvate-binding domain-containing protein n=1 Tax=Streptomyces sp. NPDC005017 TaxID=3364706 RepID=UPI0036CBB8EB
MTTLDEVHEDGGHEDGGHDGKGTLHPCGPGASSLGHGREAVPQTVALDDPAATDPVLTGSKAASLARAADAGLPVLPGFVVPASTRDDAPALRDAWRELSEGGTRPLVVRSSSSLEDTAESSQAGRFDSVLDVRGSRDFRAAVRAVRASAHLPDGTVAPMAVLVQPMLTAQVGGVVFGVDPVAGRTDRLLVSAVPGGPDALVSGVRAGTDHWLGRWGRLIHVEGGGAGEGEGAGEGGATGEDASTTIRRATDQGTSTDPTGPASTPGRPADSTTPADDISTSTSTKSSPAADTPAEDTPLLTHTRLRRLARLARRARRVFGGPQDIEFGFDEDGRLWLFQSRPVTAMAPRPERGARLLGPGPVAETLPEQLAPLEEDLWVAPMARGLAAALDIGGTAPRRLLRTVPVVSSVGGRAAADLRLLGAARAAHPWLALLNPAPGARRLAAAWRVGRLTGALPGLTTDLVADIDRRLAEVPRPTELPGPALVSTLRWTRNALVSLHAQESLAGALLDDAPGSTAAGAALAALADARARHIPDDQLVGAEPLVLALTPPSLRGRPRLPAAPRQDRPAHQPLNGTPVPGVARGVGLVRPRQGLAEAYPVTSARPPALPPRETLRLRIRWVQELQVRLVREGAHRLAARGLLDDPARAGLLRWAELITALEGGPLPGDVRERVPRPLSAPLPDAFRIAPDGSVVAEQGRGTRRRGADGTSVGRGVSGGRALGTAWDGTGAGPADAVLVVRTLDPALAPLLPRLTGLVAQTGSPLSHLAVLAREYGLPAVVGAADAVRSFPPGTRLTLDGRTGEVHPASARAPHSAVTQTANPSAARPGNPSPTQASNPSAARPAHPSPTQAARPGKLSPTPPPEPPSPARPSDAPPGGLP